MAPRVLLLLPQLPHDPASGAARTISTIGEYLAAAGFEVRGLATTLSAAASPLRVNTALDGAESLRHGIDPAGGAPTISYRRRGVGYLLQDVGGCRPADWSRLHSRQYDRLFDQELSLFRPQVTLGFGASPGDIDRRRRAAAAGARVVLGLFTISYLEAGPGPHVHAVITPSRYITERYRERWGLGSTPLPTPVQAEDVLCPVRVPTRLTAVNPSVGKGVMLLARVAQLLHAEDPEIEFEVFESRSSRQMLVRAGFAGGFDLRGQRNLIFRPMVTVPRDVYIRSRVLILPSVAAEASARVVAEALLNQVPVVVSDQGGLPENCAEGGFVLPLPRELGPNTRRPPGADAVRSWVSVIRTLFGDPGAYTDAVARARKAGERFLPARVQPQYVRFFDRILNGGAVS